MQPLTVVGVEKYSGHRLTTQKSPGVTSCMLQMRDTVRQVAHLFPTAIISGRGRDKVEAFVQLPELFYAGSHGMDIAGPRVSSHQTRAIAGMHLSLYTCCDTPRAAVSAVSSAQLSSVVHRYCHAEEQSSYSAFREANRGTCSQHAALRLNQQMLESLNHEVLRAALTVSLFAG